MLKAQVLAKLKAKFPGLPEAFLGFVADKVSAKVTEESQIEGVIDELNNGAISLTDQAAFFQAESDRRVTEAKKKWEEKKPGSTNPNPKKKKGKEDDEDEEDDDALTEQQRQLKELQAKVEAFERSQQTKSLTEQLHQKLKEKNIPLTFAKGRLPENADALDSLVTEIETDYNEVKQEFTNQGLQQMTGVAIGGNVAKDAVVSDIESWAKAEDKSSKN